ncbi:Fructose-1,6-bisphosphatase [Mycena sanguinolenta]|uniref:Fructose-1,6-bisphosphatase n=1 Tax=Mycena sanguinolenta TaxID=230812 RepID=A0A8H7D9A6_9AGAR|nr:Fructose-1,6-bisphosphatase [Mycena sanguinolenta]
MSSKPRTASEGSEPPPPRRKSTKRITSPMEDEDPPAEPPLKRIRLDGSDSESLGSPEISRQSARPIAPGSRAKAKQTPKKKSKVVVSDPESEDFDPVDDESEPEMPMEEDDDEYMSEPKSAGKRGATKGKAAKGGKGKKKPETKEIIARDERKRPVQDSGEAVGASAAKRARTKAQKPGGEIVVDILGDATPLTGTPPPREDAAPAPTKKKLPPIKKNKQPTGAATAPATSSAGTSTSTPAKLAPLAAEDSRLPPPVIGTGSRKNPPASSDVDLSNPMMYAQLFKSGGGSTPSGFTRREKDEERRKELNRMRDEARTKRINEAAPPFDLQGQMDKIARFEEKLRNARSPAVYPNFIAGGMKSLLAGRKCYDNDLEAREEGEM